MAIMTVELHVPADSSRSALLLRPWIGADMPALVAEMRCDYPTRGLWPNHNERPDRRTWTGPRDEQDAAQWLASQERGWRHGDWLTFAVLEENAPGECPHGALAGMGHRCRGHRTEPAG